MSKNLGNNVSRVLEATNRDFNGVVFQQKRPPLDSEWNLAQDISLEKIAELVKRTTHSGFLVLSDLEGAPYDRTLINSAWQNSIVLKNPWAAVNGWIIKVGGGTNQLQPNSQISIWEQLSNNVDEAALIADAAPHVGYREDFVFLEVWQKLISPADIIYRDGFVQSALPNNPNDLIDNNIEIETSRRVQIQYRIRWVKGVDFVAYRYGLGFPGCYAKGPLPVENTNYIYRQSDSDPGLWITGDGSSQSQTDLGTVDGMIYAIPIARLHRRNQDAFSNTNLNGSAVSILDGIISDRPDGLFYDEISYRDIEDLRHKASLTGLDYGQLMEETLHQLWSKTLDGELKYNPQDENFFGKKLIYVDGISNTTRVGIDDTDRNPDDIARVFSESRQGQKVSISIPNSYTNSLYYSSTVQLIAGKVVFSPLNHVTPPEIPLYDENRYFISSKEPKVMVYDENNNILTPLYGGTWEGLGQEITWNYLSGDRNKIKYTPTNALLIANKQCVFEFEFMVREGGGIGATRGGFTHQVDRILYGTNEVDNKIVDFNLFEQSSHVVPLTNPRIIGNFKDSAISRSINYFEAHATQASIDPSRFKAAVVELKYYKQSIGSSDTIPITAYGRSVLSILSIYNLNSSQYMPSTINITKTVSGFSISGINSDAGDIIEYTLLLGDYSVDYMPHTRGIKNMVKTYEVSGQVALAVGDTQGVVNVNNIYSSCAGVLALGGYYDGISYKYVGYLNGSMIFIDDIQELGSAVIKFTLSTPATVSGTIVLPILGYYSPLTTDEFYFIYEYTPYAGIGATRINTGETQRVKILKMDDKVAIATAGTGSEIQYVPSEYRNLVEALPLNKKFLEYNLFGDNILTAISGGNSSLRRIPGRGISNLREGQILELQLGVSTTSMLRGMIIHNPAITERDIDLSIPKNHVSQWSGIVEGLDALKGELFLIVITTFSSIYNLTEGPQYEYLEQKGLYKDAALGKGSETIIDNTLTGISLSQNFGEKIYGAVDLFPIKYRPLVSPS